MNSGLQCFDANWVTDFMVMKHIIDVIGNSLRSLQLDRKLLRVYVKEQGSRLKLLTEGITLQNIVVY